MKASFTFINSSNRNLTKFNADPNSLKDFNNNTN